MAISVNGVEIEDRMVEQELPYHGQAANPLKQAVHELVLRSVLLQEAERLQISAGDDDARIEALFAREVHVPEADSASCLQYYRNHPQLFTRGEAVEARHILLQVTPTVSLEFLRETGEALLAALQEDPGRFGELAGKYSNCPSGAHGGRLGQLLRGQTVPEFEEPVFRLQAGQLAPRLLETRFGLHIVQVLQRAEGQLLPFEAVKRQVADTLSTRAWQRALHQYLQILVGRASIEGIALDGAGTPLVQ